MHRSWVMSMGLNPLLCLVFGCADSGPITEPEWPSVEAAELERWLRFHYRVGLVPSESGMAEARLQWAGMPEPEDYICRPDAPNVRAMINLGLAEGCLSQDPAGRDVSTFLEDALAESNTWLASIGSGAAWPADRKELESLTAKTEAQFRGALKKTGFYDSVMAAWREHAMGMSICAQEIWDQGQGEMEEARRTIRCGPRNWERLLNVCTSDEESVESHVKSFRRYMPEEQEAVLAAFIGSGIHSCLVRIIETQGTQELVQRLERLGSGTPLDEREQLEAEVWALWRRHGVEGWLDRALEVGEIPSDIVGALDRCAGGVVPAVVKPPATG